MKYNKSSFGQIILVLIQVLILNCLFIYAGPNKKSTSKINFDTAYNTHKGNIVLAKVGDKKITVREFLAGYEFGPSFIKRSNNSKENYLKYMIDEKLLALEGYSKGYEDSAEVKKFLSAIEGDLATNQMFYKDIFNKIKIPDSSINKAVSEKQIYYNITWLFAPSKDSLNYYMTCLKKGLTFDSLFKEQLKNSVFEDQRSMQVNKFDLRVKNDEMLDVVDSLKAGEISAPIHGRDGWYIVKLSDIWKNKIITQTQLDKDRHDAVNALKLKESDSESDKYVRNLLLKHDPVIQGRAFDLLRSYMGNYVLPEDKFDKWNLDERMRKELKHFDSLSTAKYTRLTLVKLSGGNLSIDDFLNWYRMRDEYLKFDDNNFNNFSASLERLIWQMVRDHLLIRNAYSRGFQNLPIVKDQISWWRDKIIYAIVRDNLAKSIGLNVEIPASVKSKYNGKKQALIEKTFRKLQELRKKYPVWINEQVLKNIEVQDSDNPRAVDFYIVKKGGTFPHPAYPSIDFSWQAWE